MIRVEIISFPVFFSVTVFFFLILIHLMLRQIERDYFFLLSQFVICSINFFLVQLSLDSKQKSISSIVQVHDIFDWQLFLIYLFRRSISIPIKSRLKIVFVFVSEILHSRRKKKATWDFVIHVLTQTTAITNWSLGRESSALLLKPLFTKNSQHTSFFITSSSVRTEKNENEVEFWT